MMGRIEEQISLFKKENRKLYHPQKGISLLTCIFLARCFMTCKRLSLDVPIFHQSRLHANLKGMHASCAVQDSVGPEATRFRGKLFLMTLFSIWVHQLPVLEVSLLCRNIFWLLPRKMCAVGGGIHLLVAISRFTSEKSNDRGLFKWGKSSHLLNQMWIDQVKT